jgi:hypothetical protein
VGAGVGWGFNSAIGCGNKLKTKALSRRKVYAFNSTYIDFKENLKGNVEINIPADSHLQILWLGYFVIL